MALAPPAPTPIFAWKRVSDGQIVQDITAGSAGELFELAGFGAVDTDSPLNGYLAVAVRNEGRRLIEMNA